MQVPPKKRGFRSAFTPGKVFIVIDIPIRDQKQLS